MEGSHSTESPNTQGNPKEKNVELFMKLYRYCSEYLVHEVYYIEAKKDILATLVEMVKDVSDLTVTLPKDTKWPNVRKKQEVQANRHVSNILAKTKEFYALQTKVCFMIKFIKENPQVMLVLDSLDTEIATGNNALEGLKVQVNSLDVEFGINVDIHRRRSPQQCQNGNCTNIAYRQCSQSLCNYYICGPCQYNYPEQHIKSGNCGKNEPDVQVEIVKNFTKYPEKLKELEQKITDQRQCIEDNTQKRFGLLKEHKFTRDPHKDKQCEEDKLINATNDLLSQVEAFGKSQAMGNLYKNLTQSQS